MKIIETAVVVREIVVELQQSAHLRPERRMVVDLLQSLEARFGPSISYDQVCSSLQALADAAIEAKLGFWRRNEHTSMT